MNSTHSNPRTGKQEVPLNLTPEVIQKIANLEFLSRDLNRYITISDWLKTLLRTVIIEEEGFSGKRPFGNSGWKSNAEAALIQAGLIEGSMDADGFIERVEDIDYILIAVIDSW